MPIQVSSGEGSDSLYYELGEIAGITKLVDAFLFDLAEDDRVNHFFADSNIVRFREKLIEQWCVLSGGPCEYTGDDMRTTHGGHQITDASFNVVVELVYDAMEELELPTTTQNKLLGRLAPLYKDIVYQ